MKSLVVCFLLLFALPVFAQNTGGIAVVDGEKVLRDSEPGKKLFAEVKALRDKKQQEIEQRQTSIQSMQDKLNKEKDILSPDAQEKRKAEIQKALTDAKRFREDSEQEIQGKLDSAMGGMQDKLIPMIQKLGQEKGYSIIVGKQFTIWFDPKYDITEEVIKRFNESQGAAAPAEKKQ
ncbi:MAG TPA: OmpH family outer membrane protein [Acidobacteriota bacterium]|nr:OmpH family outer membrane protein [Acidobacteriota bacterium]